MTKPKKQPLWALFKDKKLIGKSHSTREAAIIEAYERGFVIQDRYYNYIADGYEVRQASPTRLRTFKKGWENENTD